MHFEFTKKLHIHSYSYDTLRSTLSLQLFMSSGLSKMCHTQFMIQRDMIEFMIQCQLTLLFVIVEREFIVQIGHTKNPTIKLSQVVRSGHSRTRSSKLI